MKALLPLLLFAAAPAFAQETCPAAAPFAGFEKPVALTASPSRRVSPLAVLSLGQAVSVTLAPTATLVLETPSETAAQPGSFGGMLELRVPLTGTYRIGLGGKAWIDLTTGGKVMASVAHSHGPDCGPVRKIVDFALTPGTYSVQLSDSAASTVTLMVLTAK